MWEMTREFGEMQEFRPISSIVSFDLRNVYEAIINWPFNNRDSAPKLGKYIGDNKVDIGGTIKEADNVFGDFQKGDIVIFAYGMSDCETVI